MDEKTPGIGHNSEQEALRANVERLTRDLAKAAVDLSEQEARFLVDAYYMMQENRKAADNQILSMDKEPHALIAWWSEQNAVMESQIKRALDHYTDSHPVGQWMVSIFGIGPVIAAGLLAHIDIIKANTAGDIWSFAGLNPDQVWEANQKRPWNAQLKTLCWKAGQSFMKFSNDEECVYGHVYKKRKEYEVRRNENGGNAERAAKILTEKNWDKTTDAYKAYSNGKLPPAHIDAQARRYAVKIFLSHLQCVWWWVANKELPPDPYAIAHKNHVDFIKVPNVDLVPGLRVALAKKRWQ